MEPPSKDRKAARTERIVAARAARAKEEANRKLHATLGDALTAALLRYLAGKPAAETMPLERAMSMIGYSDELKRLLVRCIEVNPAMEESFLKIAELAYADGKEEEIDRDYEYYE